MSIKKPTEKELITAACKLFFHKFDGHVFRETRRSGGRWVGRLECSNCGSHRVDVMMPKTYAVVYREYDHSDLYDKTMTMEEARKIWYGQRFGETE